MSSTGFYSRRQQFFREWRILWRMHGLDTFLGGVFVLAGFYAFHRVGFSQVYDVILPVILASFIAAYLAHSVSAHQSMGNTVPFYFNLPRGRMLAWDAHLVYLIGAILWMEGLILIGAMLKLGGAGMTPHYRLHPEGFALPFLAMASILSYACIRHSWQFIAACLLGIAAFIAGLYNWRAYGFWEDAERFNDYCPNGGFALIYQCTFAALLLGCAAFVLVLSRRHWRRRQVGEIQ